MGAPPYCPLIIIFVALPCCSSMASAAIFSVISHSLHPMQIVTQTDLPQLPPALIKIALNIRVGYYYSPTATAPFFSQGICLFDLDILRNSGRLHQVLAPTLARLRIDTSSTDYQRVLEEIMGFGLGTARTCRLKSLYFQSVIFVECTSRTSQETLMARASAMSASDFEANNYGMVAATESSVNEMLKTVKVGDDQGGKQDCVVCLEELRVGFEACRMPCSHIFHGDCIVTWLKQSHYCPVCRYEMPTKDQQT